MTYTFHVCQSANYWYLLQQYLLVVVEYSSYSIALLVSHSTTPITTTQYRLPVRIATLLLPVASTASTQDMNFIILCMSRLPGSLVQQIKASKPLVQTLKVLQQLLPVPLLAGTRQLLLELVHHGDESQKFTRATRLVYYYLVLLASIKLYRVLCWLVSFTFDISQAFVHFSCIIPG